MDKLKELMALGWEIKGEMVSRHVLVSASKEDQVVSSRDSVIGKAIEVLYEKCLKSDKFDIEITYKEGEYNLMTTRNGHQWSGFPLDNTYQMKAIAKALLNKVKEIENE